MINSSYKINVGKSQYHSDTLASEKRPLLPHGRPGTPHRATPLPQPDALSHRATLARRSRSTPTSWTAATAAQRLVKMVSIGPWTILMIQSIHLGADVLVPVHELSRSLLCQPLLLSTVHNFCACWHLCSSCTINITATLIAPCFIVRRRHHRPSTSALMYEPEAAISGSHAVRLCSRYMYAASRTLTCLGSLCIASSCALDRALATAGDAA